MAWKITNDTELRQSREAVELLEASLRDLRKDALPQNPQWYEVMAEGPLDEIGRIKAEITAYESRQRHRVG